VISVHRLPETAFAALAAGEGSPAVIRGLQEAQRSKHLMLLHALAQAAGVLDGPSDGQEPAAFQAGYELLARIRAADPATGNWLLGLPHLGGWLHDGLLHLDRGTVPDLAYLACLTASAAVRAGLSFEIDAPVRAGRVQLPGLGCIMLGDDDRTRWVRLCSDGDLLTTRGGGRRLELAGHTLTPDYEPVRPVSRWRGTPGVRVLADGLGWDVLLETEDRYLDRYPLPMDALREGALQRWRHRVQSTWQLLVRHHRWLAEPMAAGVSVIVPLASSSENVLISATSPAAFGAVATSWPPDTATMAETLIHEFQHVKLGGLMDMVPLTDSHGEKAYAPWREDPRPADGLLQGIYAHLGIARYWAAQRHAETDPDDILRAQGQFARWRSAIDVALPALRETGCLTPYGARFAGLLADRARELMGEQVPAGAASLAAEAALDHRLTWEFRHLATDPAEVARLADAYLRGEPRPEQGAAAVQVQENARKTGSDVRSRLLTMRYLAPARYRELRADVGLGLSSADRLLLTEADEEAVEAYRAQIAACSDAQPDAWIGLALALHRLSSSPPREALARRLALVCDVHSRLGGGCDPLDLAGWLA